MKIFKQLKKMGENEGQKGLITKLIFLGLLGLFLLLTGNFLAGTAGVRVNEVEDSHQPVPETDYIEKQSRELEQSLSLIQGVGEVRVQFLITEEKSYEYEYNTNQVNKITNESDQNGGEREIEENRVEQELVVIRDGSGREQPVTRIIKKPVIEGVIIVAQGAENSQIKYELYRAVSTFLGLPGYKINILPYKRR